jgi:hypothetical protein
MSQPESNPGLQGCIGKHSRKGPFKQLVNSYTEHLHMRTRPVENALDMAPPRDLLHEHA